MNLTIKIINNFEMYTRATTEQIKHTYLQMVTSIHVLNSEDIWQCIILHNSIMVMVHYTNYKSSSLAAHQEKDWVQDSASDLQMHARMCPSMLEGTVSQTS